MSVFKRPSFYLRLAISIAALGYVATKIDFDQIAQGFAKFSLRTAAASVTCLFLALTFSTVRWHQIILVLRGRLSLGECARLYLVSNFFNLMLPPPIGGDAYRVVSAHGRGVRLSSATESVIYDRAFALFTQLGLVAGLGPLTTLGAERRGFLVVCLLGLLTLLVAVPCIPRLVRCLWTWLPRPLIRAYVRGRHLINDANVAFGLVSLSLATHVCLGLSLWALVAPFGSVSLIDAVFLAGCVVVVTALPISLGGWGLREGGVVAGLLLVGVPKEAATSVALTWTFAHVVLALPGAAMVAGGPVRGRRLK